MHARPSLFFAAAKVGGGSWIVAIWLSVLLSEAGLASTLISEPLWRTVAASIGVVTGDEAIIPFPPLLVGATAVSFLLWLGGGAAIALVRQRPLDRILAGWANGWVWAAPLLSAVLMDFPLPATPLIGVLLTFWPAVGLAAWFCTGLSLACGWRLDRPVRFERPLGEPSRWVPASVWLAMAVYVVLFTTLTTMLWSALQIPHGDSAMYEEHLWNLLHGKGFRSYLDNNRLFLGEHVQVVHVLLVPLYLLWPHHLLLEVCQSVALAAGAVPVFWITHRHTGSKAAAILAAIGYLLYCPMQYLDIAIDIKTFRPNAFEIPFLLFGIDALERGRLRTFFVWVALTLSCQEDVAPILAPLGVWIALQPKSLPDGTSPARRWLVGLGLALFSTLYLILVIKVVLPWFRGGGDVHFANYFSHLGGSTTEILQNLVRDPGRFTAMLCRPDTLAFGLALLLPLGGLPLLSPGRLAVALPLFGILCLSEITDDPRHHFHAPIVPIVLWAGAAGLGNVVPFWNRLLLWRHGRTEGREPFPQALRYRLQPNGKSLRSTVRTSRPRVPGLVRLAACWLAVSAFCLGLFHGMTPLSVAFWDFGARSSWRMYIRDIRAEQFPAAFALVPPDSRVASTDFVHPRFTHFERSYDYSGYRPIIPADTQYIVIDTFHYYSEIHRLEQVKEYRDHPGEWDVLMNGEFIVLRRKPDKLGGTP